MKAFVHVLGLDPGMSNVGWSVFRLYRDGSLKFVTAGCFSTEKSTKKLNIGSTDDNFRRAREVARHLNTIVRDYDVKAICAEAMSFPRSSSVAAKMAMCWGALALLAEQRDPLPLVQASPRQIKQVCGVQPAPRPPRVDPGDKEAAKIVARASRAAKATSKADVQDAMCRRFPELRDILDAMPKGDREHPADSCGAVVFGVEASNEIRTLRSMLSA
jgi:Holliday junction resolvasome RuvABC endonuclease subunit